MKKFLIGVFLFFSFAVVAHADFQITEIEYNPAGSNTNRQWVEVKNTGSSAADLSSWYFATYESDGTWHYHAIAPDASVSPTIEPGGYAVIVSATQANLTFFRTDYPNFTGPLFRGSLNLSGTALRIALSPDRSTEVSDISYDSSMGASDDGNSLQYSGGAFIPLLPTPGQDQSNGSPSQSPVPSQSTGGGASGEAQPVTAKTYKPKEADSPRITTNIIANMTASAGIPLELHDVTLGYDKQVLAHGYFVWNFGDGAAAENAQSKKFTHTYKYPGEYVLTLSYYMDNRYADAPTATDREIIKILPPGISISSVGTNTDSYIELSNTSPYEIDISQWRLVGALHGFDMPSGTIILPGRKLKLNPLVTGFIQDDFRLLTLIAPSGEKVAMYPVIVAGVSDTAAAEPHRSTSVSPARKYLPQPQSDSYRSDSNAPIDLSTFQASAEEGIKDIAWHAYMAWGGLVVIIVLAGILVFYMHRKPPKELEKHVNEEDISIIE